VYERVKPLGKRLPLRSQEELYHAACAAIAFAERKKLTVFEPHKPRTEAP
jgi:hypothetical protein